MGTKQTRGLPSRLEAVRRRIEHWRLARKARSRIPDSLWASEEPLEGDQEGDEDGRD